MLSKKFTVLLVCLCAACAQATAVANPPPAATLAPATRTPAPTRLTLPTVTLAPTLTVTSTPSPTQTPAPAILPSEIAQPLTTTLLFTGDINLGRCVYAFSKAANDMALPFRAIADTLQSADITIGSLDGSISDYNPVPPCEEFHRNLLAPSETVQGLTFAGFDVITVATNHAADCGLVRGCDYESLLDTVKHFRAANIESVGGGANLAEAIAPATLTVNGTRFAFLGFSAINNSIWATEALPGTGPFESKIYTEAIRQAREQAEVVIVLVQWGREFSEQITWLQSAGAQKMVEAGATLVIGNNPHRVQGVQTFPNGAVAAYALGNFVFDQQWSDGTLYTIQGLLFKATFVGAELQGFELLPIHIYDNYRPELAPPEEAALILQDVERSMNLGPGD
jgi:poly-gamma-glutamate synthesis protein (capsule biosynthesis protein)